MLLAGPSGTGNTHLAIALGIEPAKQRKRLVFTQTGELVRTFVEPRDQRELRRIQRRLDRSDLLVLDELGSVRFDRAAGELLFGVVASGCERAASCSPPILVRRLPKVFGGDEKLTTALLDRLAHHAVLITTSFRMRRVWISS